MSYLASWLEDPDGGGIFPRQRDLIRAHEPQCDSLTYLYLPRKGGVSCITDSMTCNGCGIEFFWEGLYAPEKDCKFTNHYFCKCCLTEECDCTE